MAGIQINQELLQRQVKSLSRISQVIRDVPTSPGVSSDVLKQKSQSLKRTPPPKIPLDNTGPGITVTLRKTGVLETLLSEDGEDKASDKPKPKLKPKPTKLQKEPSVETPAGVKKPKPPPPPRNESLNKDEDEATRIRTRLNSGADVHPNLIADDSHQHQISVDIENIEEQRHSKQLRPLPTLQSLGDPPEKTPIPPLVRSEAKKYMALLGNNRTSSVSSEINSNVGEPDEGNLESEENYDDVVQFQTNADENYDDVAQFQTNGENEIEVLQHAEETFGEELYDDVEAVINESGIERNEQLPNESAQQDELYEDLPAESAPDEELYEDLPAETGNFPSSVAAIPPPVTSQPHVEEPKKTKKELEREKKEIELQRKKEERERKEREKEQKKREKIEEELMKKAKISKQDLDNPMRVCIAKCSVKAAGKFDLDITKGEKLLVIKEENGKCIAKNLKERFGYVKVANLEEEIEEDSYECIESVKQKMGY